MCVARQEPNELAGEDVDEVMPAVDQVSVVLMQDERLRQRRQEGLKTQELDAPASEETFAHACFILLVQLLADVRPAPAPVPYSGSCATVRV